CKCLTNGQWLQRNITNKAGASVKSANETILPSVSWSEKSGAVMPIGAIVDRVSTIIPSKKSEPTP
ncbi:uncharacterized protein METZ01_LOCUS320460, partial [marine metagenome]